jgi:uncharacterized protein (DUF433 family)
MVLVANFTLEQAARIARISPRRATYWAARNVLVPSVAYDPSRSPHVYIYDFVDVVGLRTLGMLRDRYDLSLQSLRKAHEYLRAHAERPWSQLRFWVRGRELFFKDPASDRLLSSTKPGQVAIAIEIEPVVREVEREARKLARRSPEDIGQTQQTRNVQHNQLVVKGTRVPVQSIVNLAEDGYSPDEIVDALPALTIRDVEVVLASQAMAQPA